MRTKPLANDADAPNWWDGIAGTQDSALNTYLLSQALNVLWLSPETPSEERKKHESAAVKMIKGVNPQSEIEGMLAVQMVGIHNAVMRCLALARSPTQTGQGLEIMLKQAAKLSSTFTAQMDALNKHRGKGQQKVTVEHVHVEHAVVGDVHTTPAREGATTRSPSTRRSSRSSVAHPPSQTQDLEPSKRTQDRKSKQAAA